MSVLIKLLLFAVFPALAFKVSYAGTDWFFRARNIPYPFEGFGAAVGLGLFFWALGLVLLWKRSSKKRSDPMKKILSAVVFFAVITFFSPRTVLADSETMARLARIEQKQSEILQKLDELMAELQIVKVRATLRS